MNKNTDKNMTEKLMIQVKPYVKKVSKLVYEGDEKKISQRVAELDNAMNDGSIDAMCEFFALTLVSRIVADERIKSIKNRKRK